VLRSLQGKTAVVTAAAQGIGRASIEALASAGARVIATDIAEDRLADLAGVSGVQTPSLDVLSADAIAGLANTHSDIHILFNCAGIVHDGAILDCSETDWALALGFNVTAMYRMVRAFLSGTLERADGCVINMSSVASSVKGVENRFAYQASKTAVIGLTKSVAVDYVARGIGCNAIAPGSVDSLSLHDRLRATGNYTAARAAFIARQPIGRTGQPEEIADLVVYLPGATYTTGQVHVIDGGWAA
jgi:2-keto-3-deoxy-L-fuconate dehydrogenase